MRGDREQLADASRILLSFTGIGLRLGGLETQGPEFVGSALRRGAPIFITDLTRSWGNRVDFESLARLLAPHFEGREVVSIGNSMGGFLSILATSYFPITTAIAFAPQFSVHPKIVPAEERWSRHRNAIDTWRFESLKPHFHRKTRYFVFFGGHRREAIHFSRFPMRANVRTFVFPGVGHDIASFMKDGKVLDDVIDGCLSGRFDLAETASRLAAAQPDIGGGTASGPAPGRRSMRTPFERSIWESTTVRHLRRAAGRTVAWFRRRLPLPRSPQEPPAPPAP